MIILMLARSNNGIIGKGDTIPWKQRADMRRFKASTMGHIVLMGRKTFDSIGNPLPGRTNLIVTRNAHALNERLSVMGTQNTLVYTSIEDALEFAATQPLKHLFVIGGSEIYAQMIDRADLLEITGVHAHVEGDRSFTFDETPWGIIRQDGPYPADEHNEHRYTFYTFKRKGT